MSKPPTDPKLLSFARDMRHEGTDAEAKLWSRLRNRRLGGFKFRRQVPLGGFILDFYCHDAALSVELDGGQHFDEQGTKYDSGRTLALSKLGVRELRFSDRDFLKDPDIVLEHIYAALTDSLRT